MAERVLLVDDEEEFTEILSERMRARGLSVDAVDSGIKAIEKAKEARYDAVILDLAMPELDGIGTLKRLLEDNPDLQVILLTGHATLEKGIEAVKLGAVDFLEKPAEIQDLMERIQKARVVRTHIDQARQEERIKQIMGSMGW